jgi:hypothetical protein
MDRLRLLLDALSTLGPETIRRLVEIGLKGKK